MSQQFLSERVLGIAPSPSVEANALVGKLRAEGKDIVNFTIGEPDLDTPGHILKAAQYAMEHGETHYTSTTGTLALREAIVLKLQRDNGVSYGLDEVVAGCGGKHIIYHALAATLNRYDEVIVHTPYWVSYPDIAKLNDATPVIIPGSESNGFKLQPAELDAAITPKTKWVILNTPNNPSGAVYSEAELEGLAQVLRKHPHVLIMSDEIYEHFVYGDTAHLSLVKVAPDLKERTLILNGASKGYAMTGWRLGFGAGPKFLIAAIAKLLSQTTTCPSSISQAAAVAAFAGDQTPIHSMREIYSARRERMADLLRPVEGVTFTLPDGAFYIYANVAGLMGKKTPAGVSIQSDTELVKFLLEEGGVATVAGAAYGLSPYVRLSFASSMDVIEEGCKRFQKACEKLS
ncbi:aminotransferase class I/II-fold pyridoxal phosphate-dependent enzyme [Pseudomonas fluorescens]|uniref:Aminotransferase n=1 Tax=Pseudomonas fluorescens TaxID=294 RepID=A0A944DJ83_PSEFL|nr:aminotransferase class I/II-fold pyridoxal phosphate-dependent enzyme [Pseudomonas fluorescens]MBT2298162.1 aminotransferase class I/II-fold pyridoxal phosphate-dependent enzyme [Pseudomonas fluorescens]MBT2309715.1 aminotransferase class I/II-fold pyridoxal phosphate-dependent enzyme [Pseudomonas fluorescens]MBT2314878.1 aminotransferase class I/II-fold pyridoxal phosphate-dependent enzyme [Pseudomonas fluorescens]MBT2327784.1 aminotransferase class I/II-fold pyridoxal phosphate-dependent e